MPTSRWCRFFTFAVYALAFFSLGIYVHTALTKPVAPVWQRPSAGRQAASTVEGGRGLRTTRSSRSRSRSRRPS